MLPANAALDSAMRKALAEPGRHPVDTFSESLDVMRFPQAQLEDEIVALLAKKYATMHVDAVVAAGPAALDFAEKHRSELWPDARILFQLIPLEKLRNRPLSPTTTGIPVQYDLAGTVELAIALRPTTRRLIVIYGSGDFDRAAAHIARTQLERFSQRLNTEYWTDASIDEFLRRIRQLDRNDAVLYLSIARDADGRTFTPQRVVEQLASVSPAPIYGPAETFIGHGTVAGVVYSYEARGKRMADLVQEALSAPAASIPLVTMASSCMADATRLERFGMAESNLPPGCDVRFASPSAWQRYRWQIVAGLAVIGLQAVTIAALVLQHRRRRRAELDTQTARAGLAHAARLASMGEITASIAHEIKQPLSAILAHADTAELLLDADTPPLGEIQRIFEEIRRDDLRASDVITRLRELLGKHTIERRPLDLNEAIGDALRVVDAEAQRRGVTIATEFASELPPIIGDRVHLQQVVLNLVLNAMDAVAGVAEGARRISVGTAMLSNGVEITVADNGSGIDPAIASRLFESFATTKTRGLGLGLSIARTIVEAHGGTIEVVAGIECGTLFRVVLPGIHQDDHGDALRLAPSGKAMR